MRKAALLMFALLTAMPLWAGNKKIKVGDLYYNITSDTTVQVTFVKHCHKIIIKN